MIERDVDTTLPPQPYDVQVTDWTFVPTSSRTPDTPAYYISRVSVRARGSEETEDAIIPLHVQPADRAALEALVRDTIAVATLKAKARLDATLARRAAIAVKRRSLRHGAPRVH